MNITRIPPRPTPPTFRIEFTKDEAWAVIAAFKEWAENHPDAAAAATWQGWASDLERIVREAA